MAMPSELNAKPLDENLRSTHTHTHTHNGPVDDTLCLPCQILHFLSSASTNIAQNEKAMAIANQLLNSGEYNAEQTNDRFNHRRFLFRVLN